MTIIWIFLLLTIASTSCRGDENVYFQKVYSQIEEFISQEEEKHSHNLEDSIGSTIKIFDNLSRIKSTELREFKQQFVAAVDEFGVDMMDGNLGRLFEYIETNADAITAIFQRINDLKASIGNSLNFNKFLLWFRKYLDSIEAQKDGLRSDIEKSIMDSRDFTYSSENPFKSFSFAEMLSKYEPDVYENIKDLYMNTRQLNLLHGVYDHVMKSEAEECLQNGDLLRVSRYNVLLSKVVELPCFATAKRVEIFAWNKVFMDFWIVKPSLDMTVISPLWEVTGMATTDHHNDNYVFPTIMDFTGRNGENLPKANDSDLEFKPGDNGETGKPGGWGGRFVAFGHSSIGAMEALFLNGGDGGAGQNGGNGRNGEEGKSVPKDGEVDDLRKNFTDNWDFEGNQVTRVHTQMGFDQSTEVHTLSGKLAKDGTNGGDGGCRGLGGHGGTFLSIGFQNAEIFSQKQIGDGAAGAAGTGGRGGLKAKNGQHLYVKVTRTLRVMKVEHDHKQIDAGYGQAGKDGKNASDEDCGTIAVAAEPGWVAEWSPIKIFNHYKFYAREYLASREFQVSRELNSFLDYLDHDEDLNGLYDIYSLIEDFTFVEKQYIELSKKISFIPFYESLINRTEIYARSLKGHQDNEKRALNYLYTAVKSHLLAIEKDKDFIAVVDLLGDMKALYERLATIKKSMSIDEYSKQFKNVVDKKIGDAKNMTAQYVMPSIDEAIKKADNGIYRLLGELAKAKERNEDQSRLAQYNAEMLTNKMIWHEITGLIKVVGSAMSFIGPEGVVADGILQGIATGANKLVDSAFSTVQNTVNADLSKIRYMYTEEISNQTERLLQDAEWKLSELKKLFDAEQTAILKQHRIDLLEMDKAIANARKDVETNKADYSKVVIQMQTIDEFLLKKIETAEKSLGKNKTDNDTSKDGSKAESNTSVVENKTDSDTPEDGNKTVNYTAVALKTAKIILTVGKTALEGLKQYNIDAKELADNDGIVRFLDNEMRLIRKHESNIYNVMMPQMQLIEDTVNLAVDNSTKKTHVELDISRWSISKTLNQVKTIFNKLSTGFTVNDHLKACIDEISNGLNTVITVYDRIDSYKEQAQMAKLIALVADGHNDDTYGIENNDKLLEAVRNLSNTININVLTKQYDIAMDTVKLHTFPFAGDYLSEFHLPFNTTAEKTMEKMVKNVKDIVDKLAGNKRVITKLNTYLKKNFFNNINSNLNTAFYTWNNKDEAESFNKLLIGQEVLFNANIKNKNAMTPKVGALSAIKFADFWFRFDMGNETETQLFYIDLCNFTFRMEMTGNSYYRCNDRIYYNSIEKPLTFEVDLCGTQRYGLSSAAYQVADNDLFLSPYTTWKLSLIKKEGLMLGEAYTNFVNRFSNQVDKVYLEGIAEFIDSTNKPYLLEICNENMDEFYRLDSITNRA